MRRLVLAAVGALLTGGCASVAHPVADQSDKVCHYAHMADVEKRAREAHVALQWLNCPMVPNKPTPEGTPVRVATRT